MEAAQCLRFHFIRQCAAEAAERNCYFNKAVAVTVYGGECGGRRNQEQWDCDGNGFTGKYFSPKG